MKRTLSLKRETLAELTTGDLQNVVGAAVPSGLTCPVLDCTGITTGGFTCLTCITGAQCA
jgi:hypothetical protein